MIGAEWWCAIGVLGMLFLVGVDVMRRKALSTQEPATTSGEEE